MLEIEKLTRELREFVEKLKYGSSTIESDIRDTLENAEDEEQFLATSLQSIKTLKGEVEDVITEIKSFQKIG